MHALLLSPNQTQNKHAHNLHQTAQCGPATLNSHKTRSIEEPQIPNTPLSSHSFGRAHWHTSHRFEISRTCDPRRAQSLVSIRPCLQSQLERIIQPMIEFVACRNSTNLIRSALGAPEYLAWTRCSGVIAWVCSLRSKGQKGCGCCVVDNTLSNLRKPCLRPYRRCVSTGSTFCNQVYEAAFLRLNPIPTLTGPLHQRNQLLLHPYPPSKDEIRQSSPHRRITQNFTSSKVMPPCCFDGCVGVFAVVEIPHLPNITTNSPEPTLTLPMPTHHVKAFNASAKSFAVPAPFSNLNVYPPFKSKSRALSAHTCFVLVNKAVLTNGLLKSVDARFSVLVVSGFLILSFLRWGRPLRLRFGVRTWTEWS